MFKEICHQWRTLRTLLVTLVYVDYCKGGAFIHHHFYWDSLVVLMSPDDDDIESKRLGCGSWWRLYACVCSCLFLFATVFHNQQTKYLLLHMEMFAFTLHRTGEDV